MEAIVGGVKNFLFPEKNEFTCVPLAPMIALVKSNDFKSLASYLRDLCGFKGHAHIVEYQGHFQIHLFFDSLTQRNSFKEALENDFGNVGASILTFKDFQTDTDPEQSDLYPLRLKAFQSAAVLFHAGACKFNDAQHILSETKAHLDAMNCAITPANLAVNTNFNNTHSFAPHRIVNEDFFIKEVCSWLPLSSVLNYVKTCKSMFQFVKEDNALFWNMQCQVKQIPLVHGISLKLLVMRHFALEEAKFFEEQYNNVAPKCNVFQPSPDRKKAIDYYIVASGLGSDEAKSWLKKAVDNDKENVSWLPVVGKSKILLALGDYKPVRQQFGKKIYPEPIKDLFNAARNGDPDAIQALCDRTTGHASAIEVNYDVNVLLLEKMNGASSGGLKDIHIHWILRIFSGDTKLPAFYRLMSEQALLVALNGIEFISVENTGFDIHGKRLQIADPISKKISDYQNTLYNWLRRLIETRLNKLLRTQDSPMSLHFATTSCIDYDAFQVVPTNKSDNARFVEEVEKTELATFFCSNTDGYQAIVVRENSWDQFKAVISK